MDSASQLSVFGFTRFSIDPSALIPPGRERLPIEDLRKFVFDPGRLQHKCRLFEKFVLPSMAAAAERIENFHHIVVISDTLPPEPKGWLYALQSPHRRWFQVVPLRDMRLGALCEDIINRYDRGNRSFNFRIDDDDAIAPQFIDEIIAMAPQCEDGRIASFDLGMYLQRLEGETFRLHLKEYPKIGIGLGMFCAAGRAKSIFDAGVHVRIEPRLLANVRNAPYWIRTLHAFNDSGMRAKEEAPMSLAAACGFLRPCFGHLALESALMSLPPSSAVGMDDTSLKALFHIQ